MTAVYLFPGDGSKIAARLQVKVQPFDSLMTGETLLEHAYLDSLLSTRHAGTKACDDFSPLEVKIHAN